MRVNVASRFTPRPLPHHYYPYGYNPPSPNSPPSPVSSLTSRRGIRRSESATFGGASLNKLPRRSNLLRRTITSSYFGAGQSSYPSFSSGDEFSCPPIEELAFFDGNGPPITSSFFPSNLDLLEPSLLGIRPEEPPHWSAREDVIRESIARKASCVELPLSLRMLKKKLQERSVGGGGGRRGGLDGGVDLDGISKAFTSIVSVIGELQGHAIRLRGLALNEDVESIVGKVQTEMSSSFIWLFQEVFSRTPDLMVNVMLLTVDFASTSVEKDCNMAAQPAVLTLKIGSNQQRRIRQKQDGGIVEEELLDGFAQMTSTSHPLIEICREEESKLWNSMVEEASSTIKMHPEYQFVAPVKVDIEEDDYSEYHRTNLLYQIGVSEEPNNPLLLCNYAQFLCLVVRNYDRAEECFQRAIQVDSTDPEVLTQYATFLWVIRKDLWGAEERYQQAVAAQPDNTYHASKYASFLWNTGGDDTCFPLDDASNPNPTPKN